MNKLNFQKIFSLILILIFFTFVETNLSIISVTEPSSDVFFEDSYVEYQITPSEVIEGNRVLKQFKNDEKGTFKWRITDIIDHRYTVKLEFDIDGFLTESLIVFIENRILYSNNSIPYGYWPFWVEHDDLYLNKVLNISGPINSPYKGEITSLDVVSNINGQVRDAFVVKETQTENSTFFQNVWGFLAYTGILLTYTFNIDFFLTINFPYYLTGTFKYLSSNLDLGPGDQLKSIFYLIVQNGIFIFPGLLILLGVLVYWYKRKKSRIITKKKKFHQN